jgi:hypothetical protein
LATAHFRIWHDFVSEFGNLFNGLISLYRRASGYKPQSAYALFCFLTYQHNCGKIQPFDCRAENGCRAAFLNDFVLKI